MADLLQRFKRKSRKSSSTSSEEDNRSPRDKKSKFDPPDENSDHDEVHAVLEMAEGVLPKLEMVLQKLETLETKVDSLDSHVKNVDAKVNELSMKVETLESTTRKAMQSIEELEKGMTFLNSEIEQLKKLEKDCAALRQEVLYMGVYQRRENLRFYGIEEDPEGAEDTQHVLVEFMKSELGIDDASDIEFQRVHGIGTFNPKAAKPRQIIARFLRYPDRERVLNKARKLKGKVFGISADLPKEIVDRRKKLLPKLFAAKKAGKPAYFSRAEPDKLFIDVRLIFS